MDITVAIGQNVGSEPMDSAHWTGFYDSVFHALERHGFTVYLTEWGTARYEDTEEGFCRYFARSGEPAELGSYHALKQSLSGLARHYKQKAIALSHVDTIMVEA